MTSAERARLLGDLLRSERHKLDPRLERAGNYRRLPSRVGHRFTQEEIAEAAGISREWYSRLENGNQIGGVTAPLAYRLADVLRLYGRTRETFFELATPHLPVVDSMLEFRNFSRRISASSSFAEAAGAAADALNRVTRTDCISVVALKLHAGEMYGHPTGPHAQHWAEDSTRMVLEAHDALRNGDIGVSDHVPLADECTGSPIVLSKFVKSSDDDEYLYECACDRFRAFNRKLRVRSVLAVPVWERGEFRGILSCGWLERKIATMAEIHVTETLAAILNLLSLAG